MLCCGIIRRRRGLSGTIPTATSWQRDSYGDDLAMRVAEKLVSGRELVEGHQGDCGIGFGFSKEKGFVMSRVHEGFLHATTMGYLEDGKFWKSQDKFVAWLSAQTDATMNIHSHDNITQERLMKFVGN